MRVPKSEVTQPRVGQMEGVVASSERWSSKYSCSSRRLCSWRDASVSSDESLPGSAERFASAAGAGPGDRGVCVGVADRPDREVPLGVLQLRHRGPELRVEPLDPIERRGDVGDLLLDEEDLRAELRVLLLQDRVLGGGAEEGEVVAEREEPDEGDPAGGVGGVLQPLAGDAELPHRLRVIADDDDREHLRLRRYGHPVRAPSFGHAGTPR